MIAWFRQAAGSPFARASAVLMSGSGVAMIFPILAAPLLGRLYAPADYGALAQYMAPAAVLSVVASLQFQHAIIAERTDREAALAAWLCIFSAVFISILTAVGVALLWNPALSALSAGAWFFLLPLTIATNGLTTAGSFLANRHGKYRWIAMLQIAHVLTTVAISISLGFAGWGAEGLLLAYFLGQFVFLAAYLTFLSTQRNTLFPLPGVGRLRVMLRRHWRFPAYTMPGEFAGQMNMQAPIFALSALGADATLGAFSRARQLVSMPVTVVGASVSQVFRRDAAKLYRETGSCRSLMLRTGGWLLLIGIGPCLLFMVSAPWLFTVYLGPAWEEAGDIARILAPMLLLRVIVSPLTTVFYFTGHQLLDLKLMIGSAVIMALAVGLGWVLGGTALAVIWSFMIGYAFIYVTYGIISHWIA